MMFVSFWATFQEGDLSNSFMGNMEIPMDSFTGIGDVEFAEGFIRDRLNDGIEEVAKVSSVTITNWKRFNT
jgi:hypothetical protein